MQTGSLRGGGGARDLAATQNHTFTVFRQAEIFCKYYYYLATYRLNSNRKFKIEIKHDKINKNKIKETIVKM
jgi:hypothetical protein